MTERDDALLNDLLDGRLSDDEAAALRTRLDAEPELAERLEELERVQTFVREQGKAAFADADVPDDFLEGVHARIAQEVAGTADPTSSEASVPASKPRGRLLRFMAVGYAAAAAVVLGVTVHWVANRPDVEHGAVDLVDEDVRSPEGDGVSRETLNKKGLGERAGGIEMDELQDKAPGTKTDTKKKDGELSAKPRPSASKPPEKEADKWDPDVPPPEGARFRGPQGAVPPDLREPSDDGSEKKPKSRARGEAKSKDGSPAVGGSAPDAGSVTPPAGGVAPPTTGAGGRNERKAPAPAAEKAEKEPREKQVGGDEVVYVFFAREAATANKELDALLARVRTPEKPKRNGAGGENRRGGGPPAPGSATGVGGGAGGGGSVDEEEDAKDPRSGFTQKDRSSLLRLDDTETPRLRSLLLKFEESADKSQKDREDATEEEANDEPKAKSGSMKKLGAPPKVDREVVTTLTPEQWKRLEALVRRDVNVLDLLELREQRPARRAGGPSASPPARGRDGSEPADDAGKPAKKGPNEPVRIKILVITK